MNNSFNFSNGSNSPRNSFHSVLSGGSLGGSVGSFRLNNSLDLSSTGNNNSPRNSYQVSAANVVVSGMPMNFGTTSGAVVSTSGPSFINHNNNGAGCGPSFCGSSEKDGAPRFAWSSVAARKKQPPKDNDPILARELGKLSPEEREKLYEEIHGIVQIPDEEPEFVDKCLKQMEDEIQKVKKRAMYNKANFLAPTKVKDRDFRLMFLRATSFDPRAAAKRIILHFEYKAILWGENKVAKQITLDDLDEDDLAALAGGSFQLLPGKDMAGRGVGFIARKFSTFKTWQNGVRYTAKVHRRNRKNDRNSEPLFVF